MKNPPELGMDHLTMLDLSPPDFVSVAGEAGFDVAGLRVLAAARDEEPWPMHPDGPMLAETLRRMDETGVSVLDVEVVRLRPDTTRDSYAELLESGAKLGARYITVNGDDPDLGRAAETFATLVADAKPYGLRPLMEAIPYTEVSDLTAAVRIAEGSDGGGILLDSLHFRRFGASLEVLRDLDRDLLACVQLCDGPLEVPQDLPRPKSLPRGQSTDGTDLQLESRAMRQLPGDGELPLKEFLAALPPELPVSLEAPVISLRETLSDSEFAHRAYGSLSALVREVRS